MTYVLAIILCLLTYVAFFRFRDWLRRREFRRELIERRRSGQGFDDFQDTEPLFNWNHHIDYYDSVPGIEVRELDHTDPLMSHFPDLHKKVQDEFK